MCCEFHRSVAGDPEEMGLVPVCMGQGLAFLSWESLLFGIVGPQRHLVGICGLSFSSSRLENPTNYTPDLR